MAVYNETQAVLQRDPENPRALAYQSLVRLAMGQGDQAEEMLVRALRKDPDLLEGYLHLMFVYTIAGLLSGLGGVVTAARAASGQAGMGMSYELDAIAASVIGGTSLSGGIGRITVTVIGTVILGIMTSGFTFIGLDAYIQDIVKGGVIVAAVVADRYRHRGKNA